MNKKLIAQIFILFQITYFFSGCAEETKLNLDEIKFKMDKNQSVLIEYFNQSLKNPLILKCSMKKNSNLNPLSMNLELNGSCPVEGPDPCQDEHQSETQSNQGSDSETIEGVEDHKDLIDYEIDGSIIMICHPIKMVESNE